MNTASARNLHVPMLVSAARGLRGLGAPIPITLTIDTPYQQVGRTGKFRIVGAPPGSDVYWSSYKDGKATGELNASYGQKIEANGTAELEWAPRVEDTGVWVKEILVKDAQGQLYTAMVQFVVSPAGQAGAATPAPATPPASGGILDTLMNEGFQIGGTFIPYWLPIAGVAGYYFLKKR